MRSTLTYGSVRGAAREGRSYRDHKLLRLSCSQITLCLSPICLPNLSCHSFV